MTDNTADLAETGEPKSHKVKWPLLITGTVLIVLLSEVIGEIRIPLGPSSIPLLPLLWALIIGGVWGFFSPRMPAQISLSRRDQFAAATMLQPALLLFIAKLGLLVGGAVPQVIAAGWALAFQEFGHFMGTMMFGLPIALLLGIKREAIGATFSIGREPSLAIIGEKFGMDSPEGRGVLAEYLTGTVFGAIFIAILAGFLASLDIFNPLALAMGAGVGSGSMMAAASGAIAAQQTPEVAEDVATFAAASNLITTTIGTYFTLFISLPFTIWAYKTLEPIIGRNRKNVTAVSEEKTIQDKDVVLESEVKESPSLIAGAWLLAATLALSGNWITYGTPPTLTVLTGMGIILGVTAVGYLLFRLTRQFLPAVLWCSIVGMAMTYPANPLSDFFSEASQTINFLALATPILAFAGLSIAKDIPAFRKLGWRIVVVSFCANAGTFLGATLIAQFFMHPPIQG